MGKVEEIVKKCCPVWERNSDKRIFSDRLLDSVGFVALVMELEEAYGIEIPIEEVEPEKFDTVEGICEVIKKLKG